MLPAVWPLVAAPAVRVGLTALEERGWVPSWLWPFTCDLETFSAASP